MKPGLILMIACILLCFSSCGTAEATTPDAGSMVSAPLPAGDSGVSEPEIPEPPFACDSGDTERPSPESGVVVSEDGEVWEFLNDPAADPEEMAKILWYRANSLYDVENSLTSFIDSFKHPDIGIRYEKFYNYSGATENVFTENGISEYESHRQGQPGVAPHVYIDSKGQYYRMGPAGTTYSYSNYLVSLELENEADGKYTYKMGFPNYFTEGYDKWEIDISQLDTLYTSMTIVFDKDKWLVDSFVDPRLRLV